MLPSIGSGRIATTTTTKSVDSCYVIFAAALERGGCGAIPAVMQQHSHYHVIVATWNVRTLYQVRKLRDVVKETENVTVENNRRFSFWFWLNDWLVLLLITVCVSSYRKNCICGNILIDT